MGRWGDGEMGREVSSEFGVIFNSTLNTPHLTLLKHSTLHTCTGEAFGK
ncbi:MAG: hypothetical protein KME17_02090 [Cyanosarcina radialis HA8281-LM2]|nr:hypothetical protein [Cyanosarcina radialis HA8281-LM2]